MYGISIPTLPRLMIVPPRAGSRRTMTEDRVRGGAQDVEEGCDPGNPACSTTPGCQDTDDNDPGSLADPNSSRRSA